MWVKIKYYDPEKVLIDFRRIEYFISGYRVTKRVRTLRTNKLKSHRERREAALFCYGMTKALNTKVMFACFESADYDIVTRWQDADEVVYCPVQLKEVVPKRLNLKGDIETENQN